MTLLGFDISHHQNAAGPLNFAAARAASRAFVVIKATDGVGWTDPSFAANRKAAHAAGLTVGLYAFAEGGNPVNEAAYFCGVVGALQPGEFLVLDWECAYSGDHVAWCKAWLDAVAAHTGVRPLIYMNRSEMNGHNWAPISSTYGLWLASYDGSTAPPAVTSWAAAAMKQYSDKGSVLGVAGGCDVNVFYGDASALAAYGAGGADMPLNQADLDAIWNYPVQGIAGLNADGSPKFGPVPAATRLGNTDTKTFQIEGNTKGTLNGDLRGDLAAKGSLLQAILDAVGKVQAPTVDPKALAAALVADTEAVATLADALAAAIAKRLGNG